MTYVRIETSDRDTRWINLDLVSRVTLGNDDAGTEVLVAMFADGDVGDSLKIRGTDEINKAAILKFQRALNHHCE